ncbi:MAG: hypothetical protein OER77_01655 [Myxococcales bacterium]|nr:hypothetical protein [Myxococcales bacterium]
MVCLVFFTAEMRGGPSSLGDLGLRHGDVVEFVIRGECMRSLANSEAVRVRRRKIYAPGDVVVVRRNDYWDAHRFLGYAPSAHGMVALTQADRAADADVVSTATAIVGRVECDVTFADRSGALKKYVKTTLRRLLGGRR